MENNKANNVVTVENESNEGTVFKRDYCPHRKASSRICKECGKIYILTDKDAMYYINKYGSMPLRCEECRKKAREAAPWPTSTEDDSE